MSNPNVYPSGTGPQNPYEHAGNTEPEGENAWRVSSFQEAPDAAGMILRSTADGNIQITDGTGEILTFTKDEFAALVKGVKAAEFDDLI